MIFHDFVRTRHMHSSSGQRCNPEYAPYPRTSILELDCLFLRSFITTLSHVMPSVLGLPDEVLCEVLAFLEARAYDVRDISLPLSRGDVDDLVGHLYRYLRRE